MSHGNRGSGNTTRALTKGLAIATGVIAAISLLRALIVAPDEARGDGAEALTEHAAARRGGVAQ